MLGYTPADRVCVPVPFYHCFGMVIGTLAIVTHGAAIVLPSEAFEGRAVLEAVQAERCTSLYGVPTMFIAELNDPEFATVRPDEPAHGCHGGLSLPDRGHAPCEERDAHG